MYKSLSAPLAVQWEFTEGCTHRCLHCYNYWRADGECKARNLAGNDARIISDQLIEAEVFRVVATGGEPFINRRVLFESIERLRFAGITVVINSNLVLLNESDALAIKDLGVASVLTSILGPDKSIHDEIVQYEGAFDQTVSGIGLLKKHGVPVSANMVVTKKNNHLVKDTASFARSLGMHSFFATKAGCPGNCSNFSDLRINISEFRKYLEDLYSEKESGFSVDVLEAYPLCGIKEINRYRSAANHRCLAGVTTLTIGVDGCVRPCSHLDVNCGNVISQSLIDVWSNMESWRGKEFLSDICKECDLVEECGGGCKMEAKMAGGRDPFIVPEDVKYVRAQMHEITDEDTVVLPKVFRLNPKIKWRLESFGSVALIEDKKVCYLDSEATLMLRQLSFDKDYRLRDLEEVYGSGLESFLTQLYARHFWIAVE